MNGKKDVQSESKDSTMEIRGKGWNSDQWAGVQMSELEVLQGNLIVKELAKEILNKKLELMEKDRVGQFPRVGLLETLINDLL